jgi:hypothetical protein
MAMGWQQRVYIIGSALFSLFTENDSLFLTENTRMIFRDP